MTSRRNVYVVGLDDFHRDLLETMEGADELEFRALFDADDVANGFDGPMEQLLELTTDRLDEADGPPHAIIGHWDFPTSTILPILQQHAGLGGPSLEAVLKCEHKYWSRLEQRRAAPDHVPEVSAFDPFRTDPRDQVDLDYPFWVKPVKSHSSYLGFHVADDTDFAAAMDRIRRHIEVVARPFNTVLDHASDFPAEIAEIDGYHCIAEELVSAPRQITFEGYVLDGETTIYGTVDTGRGGDHGSSLVEYGYPSTLDEGLRAEMRQVAEDVMGSLGYDDAPFNVEFFCDPDTGEFDLLEINPRISKSHAPLFLLVDGSSHHQVAVRVALGEDPAFPSGQGQFPHASKFMLRHHGPDAVVSHAPSEDELAHLRDAFPELRLHLHVESGMQLSELSMQESYSYGLADLFLGGDDPEGVRERWERVRAEIPIELEPLAG